MEMSIFGVLVEFSKLVSSFGLILDIVGALIIFHYGLPQNIDRSGKVYIVTSEVDETEKSQANFFDRMSLFGISLLVLGFIMQGAGNWL
jgi:hypothetical protein